MKTTELISGLPGESLVRKGLSDLSSGKRTISAYLVSIGRRRFENAGLLSPADKSLSQEPELELYRLLRSEGGDAYSRYNALVRELISFEQALDRRIRQSSKVSR